MKKGTTGVLPLMVVDQAILHSIDKCSECPVCVCVGGGGDEGGHHRYLASDGGGLGHSAPCEQVWLYVCVHELGRGVEGRGDGGGGCHRHHAADRCGPGHSAPCELVWL